MTGSTAKIWSLVLVLSGLAGIPGRGQRPDVIQELLDMQAPEPGRQLPAGLHHGPLVVVATENLPEAPPDDAPLEELVRYWTSRAGVNSHVEPSERVKERLLQACEEDPARLPGLIGSLPDSNASYDRVRAILDWEERLRPDSDRWKKVRQWLMFRSGHFRQELIRAARAATDESGWVRGEQPLRALAKLDWNTAQELLRTHEAGKHVRTASLATAVIYAHAAAEGHSGVAESYRNKLRSVVADQGAPGKARDLALDALMETQWDGRDEWYLSLFADATLRALRDGIYLLSPLASPVSRDPDRWIPVMARMVGHESRAVHDAAVSCLVQFHLRRAREDALRPLLPWLMDNTWSSARDRLRLIQSMDLLDMKASVPGLIQVVGKEQGAADRSYAAESLAKYGDPRAVPALRAALAQEKGEDHRRRLIKGLIACGGLEVTEAVQALETLAAELATTAGRERIDSAYYSRGTDSLPVPLSIGLYLSRFGPPSESIAMSALTRARDIEQERPNAAKQMLAIVQTWRSDSVDRDIVRRIADGVADSETIRAALERRETMRETVGEELTALLAVGGVRGAIAGVLSGAREAQLAVLSGDDAEARRMLLACARLVREPLPLKEVGRLVRGSDRGLREAAERYLTAEDSAEARELVQALHPGEALILGARQGYDPGHNTYAQFDQIEEQLREDVRAADGPDEILAMLTAGYWGDQGQIVIRRRQGRAELTYYKDEAIRYERELADAEWDDLTAFLIMRKVDDLPPLATSIHDGTQFEYLRLRRDGGRRVFMNNPQGGSVYGLLVGRFFGLLETQGGGGQ